MTCVLGHVWFLFASLFPCDCTRRLGIRDNRLHPPLLHPSLSNKKNKDNCRPANFITTALNSTVLEPSNYSFLRCGRVEKGRKSTEVGAPGLELWENWKQMICPFLHYFLFSRHPSFQHLAFRVCLLILLTFRDDVRRPAERSEATIFTRLNPRCVGKAWDVNTSHLLKHSGTAPLVAALLCVVVRGDSWVVPGTRSVRLLCSLWLPVISFFKGSRQ